MNCIDTLRTRISDPIKHEPGCLSCCSIEDTWISTVCPLFVQISRILASNRNSSVPLFDHFWLNAVEQIGLSHSHHDHKKRGGRNLVLKGQILSLHGNKYGVH